MLSRAELESARARAAAMLEQAAVVLRPEERGTIDVLDFGLGDLERTGLQMLTYVDTEHLCAKELVVFPTQTCPEHRHPPHEGSPGKEETFRCRWGLVYLYVEGEPTREPKARPPRPEHYTVWRELVLGPGEQFTIPPNTRHWFQGGRDGAVVSELATWSRGEFDEFTDPEVEVPG